MNLLAILQRQLRAFGRFLYNRDTHEILNRTCSGWAQIGVFFLVFYLILAIIFAIHLALFLAITPGPAVGRPPWNHGGYAYTNYPNRKIDLILTPRVFTFNMGRGEAILSNYNFNYMSRLASGANTSGVESHCLDRENRFGYSIGQPCIYLHIAKVFDWTASLINSSLAEATGLPFNCTFSSDVDMDLMHSLILKPSALPLNISNNANLRSFPFNNQQDYRVPVIGLSLDLTMLPDDLPNRFSARVTCILNFNTIGMTRPSDSVLNRIYEIPTEAVTTISFQ